jgi:hypothetical protein
MTGHQRLCSVLPPDRRAAENLERVQRCRDGVADVGASARSIEGLFDVA